MPLEVESGKTTDQGKIPEAGVPKKFVRVQGQLWRTGVLQEDVDLCFLRLDPTRAGDWDFTDEEGRFEVELTTGIYDVLEESTGQFLARVNVPEEAEAWVCDLVLP